MTNFTWVFQPMYTIMAKPTNQFQGTRLITSSPEKHYSLDSEDVSAQVQLSKRQSPTTVLELPSPGRSHYTDTPKFRPFIMLRKTLFRWKAHVYNALLLHWIIKESANFFVFAWRSVNILGLLRLYRVWQFSLGSKWWSLFPGLSAINWNSFFIIAQWCSLIETNQAILSASAYCLPGKMQAKVIFWTLFRSVCK